MTGRPDQPQEFGLIERIRERTRQHRDDVILGIGDDAAVLAVPAGRELVVAIDTLVDGVHFPRGTAPTDIGWKSLAVNLSDLAAMGATPAWALMSLTLPTSDADFVDGIAEGFAELAASHRLALVGGDTTRGPLSVSVVVQGLVSPGKALRRDGAKVGDAVLVTGTLGDAAAGLQLSRHAGSDADDRAHMREFLSARLNRPTPRLAAGAALRDQASACIDISDGLLADLGHICTQSGVGAELEANLLPCSSALMGLFDDTTAAQFALCGGDDYELCFTVPQKNLANVQADLSRLGCGVTRIGRIVAGEGVRVRDGSGRWRNDDPHGWEHFS